MICPKCNQENLDKVRFCIDCGEPLTATAKLEEVEQNNITEPISDINVNADSLQINKTTEIPAKSSSPTTGELTIASAVIRDGKKYALGKNAIFSVILSFVFQGLGQFYNGDYKKGVALIIASIAGYFLTGGILNLFLWIYGMVDAFFVAKSKWPLW